MSSKESTNKRPQRETNATALRLAVARHLDQRIIAQGDLAFPCIPSMLDIYMSKLAKIFEALGQPFSTEDLNTLRGLVEATLAEGYKSFPYGKVIVSYIRRLDRPGVGYNVRLKQETMADVYQDWVTDGGAPPFGKLPDAKVLALAKELGEPSKATILDIGAGTGRNALALARLGHPVDALEPTAVLAKVMRESVEAEKLPVMVIEADVFAPQLTFAPAGYTLVVLAEVISHFRGVEPVRQLFSKLSDAVAPGGLVLVSTFLTSDGYKPDALALEASETAWSYLFTRADLKFIVEELPFDKVSDESAHDFEKEHLPAEGWPPTPWFPKWSQALDVFELPPGKAPAELRWLVFRRRP
jgi:2-polyprenyl-3-methyl-5-hydroxy-6-metoxy-1,4-benzoquinol methylase